MIHGACHRSVAAPDAAREMKHRRREDEEPSTTGEPKMNGGNSKNRIDYVASSESMTSSSESGGTVVLDVEDGDAIGDGDGEDDGTSSSSSSTPSTGQGDNSEENENDTSSSRCCERGRKCRPYDGDREALGFALDSVPRGAAVMGSAVFVGTALLHLANEAAGCPPPAQEAEFEEVECSNRVYGMRPSSLLTTIQFVVSVTVALSMPLIGAVIDHTPHRRTVGLWSAVSLTLLIFCQIFISAGTWFVVAIVQVFAAVAYCVHSTAAFAYLPEISSSDKDRQLKYYGSFTVVQFVSTMLFLALVVATATLSGIDDDAVATARLSQGVVFALSSIFFGVAWTGGRMFGDRPASSRVPPGRSLLTAGFVKLFHTVRMIRRSYPAVGWTLLAVSLSEAAVASFVTIAITFVTERLHFSATQNGIAILVLLGSTVPGSLLGTAVTKSFNPVRSVQFCLALWIVTTAVASAVLAPGSTSSSATYAFAVGWGVATGWYFPAERALYCTIIPPENNAELMGTYLCACGVLGWLPPLIFTVLNENGVDMRVGLASLILYFGASWMVYGCLVGDYDVAVENAKGGVVANVEDGSYGKHGGADVVAGVSSSASSCEEAEDGERRVGHGCCG